MSFSQLNAAEKLKKSLSVTKTGQLKNILKEPLFSIYYLQGSLDIKNIEQAYKKCTNHFRHYILKNSIDIKNNYYNIDPLLEYIDLSHLASPQKETELQRLIQKKTSLRNVLNEKHGWMHAGLFKLNSNEHLFFFFLKEKQFFPFFYQQISEYYNAALANRAPILIFTSPETPTFHFKIKDKTRESNIEKILKDSLAYLDLPYGFSKPKERSYEGRICQQSISMELYQSLKKLAKRQKVNFFTLIFTIFQILLYRYSRQDKSLIALSLHNNFNSIDLNHHIIPIETDYRDQPKFTDFLKRVKNALYAKDLPKISTDELIEKLGIEGYEQLPLSQVNFKMELNKTLLELKGIKVSSSVIKKQICPYELIFTFHEQEKKASISISYATDLFTSESIEKMQKHFQNLCKEIVSHPDKDIRCLEMLAAKEEQQILGEWDITEKEYPKNKTIHQLFEEQVEKTPNNVAIAYDEQQLTYQQLNEKANQLAYYLREKGVQPDTLIAIACERSLEMIIGILGILKAGGAYVPVDPSYPPERVNYMLSDMKAPFFLTQAHLIKQLPKTEAENILLDRDKNKFKRYPTANPPSIAQPHHLAYVIYTSGSTGKPKGVLIEHQNVQRLYTATQQWFEFNSKDIWTLFHSFAFDFSVWEIWGALFYGGKICIVPYEISRNASRFHQMLIEEGVTVLNQTPSAFQQLSTHDQSLSHKTIDKLRYIIFGGEALNPLILKPWFERYGDQHPQFINMYGITETTVHVTYFPLHQHVTNYSTSVIGRPIPDLQVYILDSYFNPVPVNVIGEMYIGGRGLARGYLNRTELTQQRFISSPFNANKKLYKTGDLARYLPDGNIEYIGRSDSQVKIRGFRIELGEIENTLLQHSAVKEAVVIAREGPGDKKLAAYVVLKLGKSKSFNLRELRSHLSKVLPEYMIPAFFMVLEAFPLTENGKVDRKNLPIPEYQGNEEAYIAPRTDLEKQLCEIWQSILKIERIGIEDNFFELGGDSILNIQIASQARKFGLFLKPRDIFQHPTIAKISPLIEQTRVVPIKRENKGAIPLLPIQQWFFESQFADPHHWNQFFLLKLNTSINQVYLEKALTHVFLHHEEFQIAYKYNDNGSTIKQSYKKIPSPLQIDHVNLKTSSHFNKELEDYVSSAQKTLNFEKGPLHKVVIIDGGPKQGKFLLIIIHHLVIDGISWRILWEDIENAYHQIANHKEIRLLERFNTYKDWGLALQNYARSEESKKEIPYWLSINFHSPLPRDFDKGINTWEESKNIKVTLSRDLTHKLLQEAPRAYHTQINDILLTALTLAFNKWTGKKDLFLHLEGHGREDFMEESIDLSRTIGWFTTLFPVNLNLALTQKKDVTLGDYLKTVKEQLRAIPHRGVGYGALRYMSGDAEIKEKLEHLDTAEISFNYLGQLDTTLTKDSLFQLHSFNPSLDDIGLKNKHSHIIDINSYITNDELTIDFAYGTQIHHHETIKALANRYLKYLTNLIYHCEKVDKKRHTSSDFPLISLSQEQIENLFPEDIQDAYPQTPIQQGLLFHTLKESRKGIYLNQTVLWLEGNLNQDLLKEAWTKISGIYDILRTSFIWEDLQHPIQIVHAQVKLPWESKDWQNLSQEEIHKHLEALLTEDRQQEYDLTHAPLMRIYFLRLSSEKAILVWSHHHIILDGWSLPNVISMLFSIYENQLQKKPTEISYIRPFKDYVTWGINQDYQKGKTYWKDLLKDFETPTSLGIENKIIQKSSNLNTFIDSEILNFSQESYKTIKTFAQSRGLTLSSLLHGVWGILLSRYSGQTDIVFGSVSGRSASLTNMEKQVGLFINTLPVRIQTNGSEKLEDYLKNLQDQMSCSREYEYMPLWEIQSLSAVASGNPLFNCIVAFDNYATADFKSIIPNQENLKILESQTFEQEHYDLNMVFSASQNFWIEARYNATRYEKPLILKLLKHYERLLEEVMEHPTYVISQLDMLAPEEKKQILIEWNDTKVIYLESKCIHELFEEQVEKTPNKVAVVYEEQKLTYQELNERANQLAHYLHKLGVKPDTLVAISVERSLEMVIGLLGILKAGGAYVPLDPSYPPDRLDYVIGDTKASILLTQEHLKNLFKSYSGIILSLNYKKDSFHQESILQPPSLSSPRHLAYVLYTSGSTGKPKGVMISHKGIVNILSSMNEISDGPGKGIILNAPLNFDPSVWMIFWPLVSGSAAIIPPKAELLDNQTYINLIKHNDVEVFHAGPALLNTLLQDDDFRSCQSIRYIIGGGEAWPSETLEKLKTILPKCVLQNVYGPTESSIHVTSLAFDDHHSSHNKVLPIGRPISNIQIYILDQYLNPVPVGIKGEIYIGGVGLARGYLNRSDLTAEKFIPNPFLTEENDEENQHNLRLYCTGDLACYLPDGNIEFLGRIDDQVKIRGFRIELGEIELTLKDHQKISQAVVMAWEDKSRNKRLIAYVVPHEIILPSLTVDSTFTSSSEGSFSVLGGDSIPALTEDLRNYLVLALPDYMVPSFFIYLNSIPLTRHGKIDRKSFPVPDLTLRQVGDEYISPQTALEQELCSIWSEVLKVEEIGIQDNFFRTGGDSIISIQLVSKARQRGIFFTIKDLFNHPTIVSLTSVVKTQESILGPKPDQALITGDVLLTPIQQWFFDKKPAEPNHFNQATLLLVREKLDFSFLNQVLSFITSHHDALRFRYIYEGQNKWKQECLEHENSQICILVDLSSSKDDELSSHIESECFRIQQNLDIKNGPVIKAVLFNCGPLRQQRLFIVIHHLLVDGVSWRILIEDIEKLYSQLAKGEAPGLLPKTHSYQQWAKALHEYAYSQTLKEEIAYWQEVEDQIKLLPVDFNHGPAIGSPASTFTVSLTEEETTKLLKNVPKAYRTQINDILLTALVLAIGDWTKGYALSLALEGHGREDIIKDIDLSRTVGWFTSIFPVCLNIKDPNDLGEAIKTIKENLRQIPLKGIGYGVLSHLSPNSISFDSSSSQPSLSFNYLGQWDNTASQEGFFTFTEDSVGPVVSDKNELFHFLNIDSEIKQGTLQFFWTYSRNHYHSKTIEELSHTFIARLRQLIKHCCHQDAFGYTPSDFALASLSQTDLDSTFGNIPNIEDIYPLSPMQSGLLFQALYAPQSDAYFVQTILELEGKIDISILLAAWQKVSDHHPLLKTGFVWEGLDSPLQYTLKSVEIPFKVEDWKALREEEQEEKLQDLIKKDRTLGFDLSKPPLFRVTLILCSKNKQIFIWSMHHILTDGWCLPIILRDIFKAYADIQEKREVRLLPSRPYQDYIAWLQQQDREDAEIFWKDYLANFEEPTRLSFKDTIQENNKNDYDTYSLDLSLEETEKIKNFAQQNGLTLNTLIQGAIGTVLKGYTQQEEIVMGVTVSGRSMNLPGVEEMVGLFINTLPLRMFFNAKENTLSFLSNLQKQTQKLNEHAHTSLAQIQSWANIRGRLFDVIYVFENYPIGEEIKNSTLGFFVKGKKDIEKNEYPLTIIAKPGNQLHLLMCYQTEHFNEFFIKQLSGQIKELLGEMIQHYVESPDMLSFLTSNEKQEILIDLNTTKKNYSKNKGIHELFEKQVEKTPHNVAAAYENDQLTYQELNTRANQLAHYLRKAGVENGTVVGIAFERSMDMLVGLLGVLKAGGAYVPLDPSYPEKRIQFMLEDTQAKVLLIQSSLNNKFNEFTGNVVRLDTLWQILSQELSSNLCSFVSPHDLAYVIYTSGSTGKPKGVMVEHGNLVHYISYAQGNYCLTNGATLLHSSIAFDMSVTSIFLPLITGKTLHILPSNFYIDSLGKILSENQNINFIKVTPSHLKALKGQFNTEGIRTQKSSLIVGGENLLKEDLGFWLEDLPNTTIFNEYGPTEATVGCSVFKIEDYYALRPGSVPIGRPISNTKIFLLNKRLNPVPIGGIGELYIGGEGITRGYLNRPDLTAEKFIPNPFISTQEIQQSANLRLYRTGDLARYLPDGNIEYLGRTDEQVKIRGFRIELGEIETTLGSYGDIEQAAVLTYEDDLHNKRLAAYVVPGEFVPSSTELREFLLEKLPEYMIPNTIMILDKFPLDPNGKLDRKALPTPKTYTENVTEYVTPRNEIEENLAHIWKEVLQTNQVSIHDNFFQNGGDSIISIQLTSRARRQGISLTVKQVFENPTIAELSRVAVVKKTAEVIESALNYDLSIPLTPIQKWFFSQNHPEIHHFNQAQMLHISPEVNLDKLRQALGKVLLCHHETFRLRYRLGNAGWEQYLLASSGDTEILKSFHSTQWRTIDVSKSLEPLKRIEKYAEDLHKSLNITDGPLLRTALFTLGDNQPCYLLIVIHHLLIDGVSWRILLEDLNNVYQQLSNNSSPSEDNFQESLKLLPPTYPYRKWALAISNHANSEACKNEFDYWLKFTSNEVQRLPIDYKNKNRSQQSSITVKLNQKKTTQLLKQVPKAYHTQINDILLTALLYTISNWTNQKRVYFWLEGHGREDIFEDVDLSRTMGWFTSLFPVYLYFGDAPQEDFGHALKEVKEQLRQIPRQGVGYGLLRYLSQDNRAQQLKNLKEPQISFNYLGQWDNNKDDTFYFIKASTGNCASEKNSDPLLLNINALVREGQLEISWEYDKQWYKNKTIDNLSQEYLNNLNNLINHCCNTKEKTYTPADFPLAQLGQTSIDALCKVNRGIEDIYPLAPLQEGLLFQKLHNPNSDAYLIQNIYELDGKINVMALHQAWKYVIAQYSALRTGIVNDELDRPLQYVISAEETYLPWYEHDWSLFTSKQQTKKLEALIQSEKNQGFDLTKPPLMRLHLIYRGGEQYILVWTQHHSVIDGWCFPIILTNLFDTYHQLCKQNQPNLEVPRPYRDYIAWLQQQDRESAEQFWQTYLAGFNEVTHLVIKKSALLEEGVNSSQNSYESIDIDISSDHTELLVAFAKKHQLTLNTVLQGAWSLLMGSYAQQEDIVFGVTVSGRSIPLVDVEDMIGPFINTVPLRVELIGNKKLKDFFKELQEQFVQLNQFSYISLGRIQSLSKFYKSHGGGESGKLFDTLFVFENYPLDKNLQELSEGLVINDKNIERTEYPLTMVIVPGQSLSFHLSYDTKYYMKHDLVCLVEHLIVLLTNIIKNPEAKLSELSMLAESERKLLLEGRNVTQVDFSQTKTIHELFEEQVKRTPMSIALAFEDIELTYQELNQRANKLAHHLRKLGVQKDNIVGISAEKSLELIIGILGILKAGGAYVPLDTEYPIERLKFMLEDSQAKVLLTQKHLLSKLPSHHQTALLEGDNEKINRESDTNLTHVNTSTNLAYVIYTSGSTGKPKGVPSNHLSVINRFTWSWNRYPLHKDDVFCLQTNIGFVDSVWDIFGALLKGIKLAIFPIEVSKDVEKLVKHLKQQKVTRITLVPSFLKALLQYHPDLKKLLPKLNHWEITGEVFPRDLITHFLKTMPDVKLIDVYGATEATSVIYYEYFLNPEASQILTHTLILANTQIYILDKYLRPVPIGIPGELYIGGIPIAEGYLNREELTKEKFIPNLYCAEDANFYKTGDLACYTREGNVELLGRTDHQVKIRGFRVELGEIESVLREQEGISDAVANAYDDTNGYKILIAYVVFQDKMISKELEQKKLELLQNQLRAHLPDYMLPRELIILDKMPFNPNGKIDRQALPLAGKLLQKVGYVPPVNATEFQLVKIWEDLLNSKQVGIFDNFFEIGGNSILLINLVSKIKKILKKNISITDIFKNSTIFTLANLINKDMGNSIDDMIFEIQPSGTKSPLFMVHSDDGLAFIYTSLSYYLEDQPLYGINNPRFGQPNNPFKSIEEMASCYVDHLLKVYPEGPYRLGGLCFSGVVALEMALQLQDKGKKVEALFLIDSFNASWRLRESDYVLAQSIEEFLISRNLDTTSEAGKNILFETINNAQILNKYYPRSYKGYAILLKAKEIGKIFMDVSQATDPYNGWATIFQPDLEICSTPDEHLMLLSSRNIKVLSEKITYYLSKLEISHVLKKESLKSVDRQLLNAAKNNDIFLISKFLERNANVNAMDEFRRTSLHWAVHHRNINAIELLIENGADKTLREEGGKTPSDLIFNEENIVKENYSKKVKKEITKLLKKENLTSRHKSILSGLTINGKILRFKAVSDPLKEGILNLIGKNRKEILEQFISSMDDIVIRKIASPELSKILLSEDLPEYLKVEELINLKQAYVKITKNLEKQCKSIKEKIPENFKKEIVLLDAEEFLDWLSEQIDHRSDYKYLSLFVTKEIFPIEEKLKAYSQNEKVFQNLISWYLSKEEKLFSYIGNFQKNSQKTCMLDSLLYINKTRLMIWQKDPKNNSRVLLVHSFGSEDWLTHVHLLHDSNSHIYYLLQIIDKMNLD